MTRHPATIIVALFLWATVAFAQTSPQVLQMPLGSVQSPQPASSPKTQTAPPVSGLNEAKVGTSLPTSDAEYHLGPGDLIEIGVFGVEEFRQTIRLNSSGVITLPLLEPINASGLTPVELEQRITALLADDVIKNPHVTVFVKEYRSQPVYVLGSVRSPGQYQITLQMRVVDAISMAGGLLPGAGDEATIQRPSQDGGEQSIKIDIRELIEKGDLSRNIVVRGGDVLNIPERLGETVYVLGEVNRPGAFALPPKQEWRVSQLLAYAGGASKTARLANGMLIRYDDSGERKQMPLDLAKILRGKQEDFYVRANDVIFIPNSRAKEAGNTVLNMIPTLLLYRIPFP